MKAPMPTPIYRFLHIDNLSICLERGALYAPNHEPGNGLAYRSIHNIEIQQRRRITRIPCGPGGVIHDYVSFYFGARSPMLFQLHTGKVEGYNEGQEPIIYLVSTAQAVCEAGAEYVFSDGHGVARFTEWFEDLGSLDQVDWKAVHAEYWADTGEEPDRQRRKQAEFLVHRRFDWSLIKEIGVIGEEIRSRVIEVMSHFAQGSRRPINIRRQWYY